LKPAPDGNGIIAGGPVRAVMEVAGISNVLTKSIGTSNPHNVIKATFDALLRLQDVAKVAEQRSKTVRNSGAKRAGRGAGLYMEPPESGRLLWRRKHLQF